MSSIRHHSFFSFFFVFSFFFFLSLSSLQVTHTYVSRLQRTDHRSLSCSRMKLKPSCIRRGQEGCGCSCFMPVSCLNVYRTYRACVHSFYKSAQSSSNEELVSVEMIISHLSLSLSLSRALSFDYILSFYRFNKHTLSLSFLLSFVLLFTFLFTSCFFSVLAFLRLTSNE